MWLASGESEGQRTPGTPQTPVNIVNLVNRDNGETRDADGDGPSAAGTPSSPGTPQPPSVHSLPSVTSSRKRAARLPKHLLSGAANAS